MHVKKHPTLLSTNTQGLQTTSFEQKQFTDIGRALMSTLFRWKFHGSCMTPVIMPSLHQSALDTSRD